MAARSAITALLSTAAVALLCAPVGLQAQEQDSTATTPPAPAKHQKELEVLRTPRGFLEAASFSKLLKLPDWLNIAASWTAEPMGNTWGGAKRTTGFMDQLDLEVSLGRGLTKQNEHKTEFDRWALRLSVANYQGQPPYFNEEIGTVFALQQLLADRGFWLQGLWVERVGNKTKLRFGNNYNLDQLVYAPAYGFYVNSTLNGTLNLTLPAYPFTPSNAAGGQLSWKLTDRLSSHYGAMQLSNQRGGDQASFWKGWRFNVAKNDGLVQALRLDLKLSDQEGGPLMTCRDPNNPNTYLRHQHGCEGLMGLENNLPDPLLQLGAVAGSWRFPLLNNSERWENKSHTVFGSATLPVKLPIGHGARVWGSSAVGMEPAINQVPLFFQGGVLVQGVLRNRPLDLLILGASRSSLSPYSRTANGDRQSFEGVIELGYLLKINQNLQLQPGAQWVINPGGAGQYADVVAPSVQVSLTW